MTAAEGFSYAPTRGPQGAATSNVVVEGGRSIRVPGLDRAVFPAGPGTFTRADLVEYHRTVAPAMLPHVADRPFTLRRYPDGVGGAAFEERGCPRFVPEWMRTEPVWNGELAASFPSCVVDDVASLVWLVGAGAVELPVGLARRSEADVPVELVLQLDPATGAGAVECCLVATVVHDMLGELGLASWAMTNGERGIAVRVPLGPSASFPATREFARTVAETLERSMPGQAVADLARSGRPGVVHVDWRRNTEIGRIAAPWSLRATPTPTVAMPLDWAHVHAAGRYGDAQALHVTPTDALQHLDSRSRELAALTTLDQHLPEGLLV